MFDRILKGVDVPAAIVSGLAGGVAFVATMAIDNRISGRKLDDLRLLGRPIAGPDQGRALAIGAAIHAVNSAGMGVLYARFGADNLPGPPWLRGVVFFTIENTILYPLTALDHKHPGVAEGSIDSYWSLPAYLWTFPRHAAFGAVTAATYEALREPATASE